MWSTLAQTGQSNLFTFDDLLALIARLAWVVFAIYTIVIFVRTFRHSGLTLALFQLVSLRVMLPLLLTGTISLLGAALVFVQPNEVAVVVSLLIPGGVRSQPLTAGLHWIVPVLEYAVKYPVAWQTYTMASRPNEGAHLGDDSIRARTSDGQEVTIDSSMIFRIDAEQVVRLHTDWQDRYPEDLVRPLIRSVVRTQVSQFTVKEVNSSARKDLEATLDRLLHDQLGTKGLIVDQFLIRDIEFTPEYAAAVEHKQVALEGEEQKLHEAQQLRNLAQGQADAAIIAAKAQADAVLIAAKAQSEALRLIANVLKPNPELLTYRYIDKLSPNIRIMLLPNNAPLILPLPTLEASEPLTATMSFTLTPMPTAMPATADMGFDVSQTPTGR